MEQLTLQSFSILSFFHAISFNFFSISHLPSVWEWGISLLSQPHGAADFTIFGILLRPQGLLSFGVLNAFLFNWFCLLFILGFLRLIFLLWDGSAPNGVASCLLCYFSYSWLRYKRRHKLLATSTWIWISSFSPKLNVNLRTMRGSIHGKLAVSFLIWFYLTSFSLASFIYFVLVLIYLWVLISSFYSDMLLL